MGEHIQFIEKNSGQITTSQLRKILTAAIAVSSKIDAEESRNQSWDGDELPEAIAREIRYIKTKMIYQIGREQGNRSSNIKDFLEGTGLLADVDKIGRSKRKFRDFGRKLEEVVAYHKFYGGKEK